MIFAPWRRVLTLGLALFLLTGCVSTDNGAASVPSPDSPLAFRLADTTVTQEDFVQRLDQDIASGIVQLLEQGNTPEEIRELALQQGVRQSVLDTMIQEELLLQVARDEGISVDPATIDQAVAQQQLANPTNDSEAQTEDDTELRVRVARQQLVLETIAQNTRADMFESRHILVADDTTAQTVLDALDNGDDFAELATEYSEDPGSAEQGGELGWVPRGDFVPEFEQVALGVRLNTPVTVTTDLGVHVFEVLDREREASRFQSRHILVEDSATAEEVFVALSQGENFAELATEYSQDAETAEDGGDLDWLERGEFEPAYELMALGAEIGIPVTATSQFGVHIIIVADREDDRAFGGFEELVGSQSGQLHYEQTFQPWYDELRQSAEDEGELEINPDFDPAAVPLPFPEDTPASDEEPTLSDEEPTLSDEEPAPPESEGEE